MQRPLQLKKPECRPLYDDGLNVFTSPTALAATVNSTNTFIKACTTLNTTLTNTKTATDASVIDVVKTKLQSVYDNGLAIFTAPASLVAAINANNTTTNLYLTFNTTHQSSQNSCRRFIDYCNENEVTVCFIMMPLRRSLQHQRQMPRLLPPILC